MMSGSLPSHNHYSYPLLENMAMHVQPIRSAIIDDEKRCVALLETLLKSHCPHVEIVATANSVRSGLEMLKKHRPQLVFLDIALPDGDGFEIMEALDELEFDVVFTTAYNQFAIRAFQFAALHYLLKPINIDQLEQAIRRFAEKQARLNRKELANLLKEGLHGKPGRIALPRSNGYALVRIEEIIHIEAEGGYCWFFLRDGKKLLVSRPIGEYEKMLEEYPFFRTHKRHLINMNCVSSFERGKHSVIVLSNGREVSLSYRRREEFIDCLKNQVTF